MFSRQSPMQHRYSFLKLLRLVRHKIKLWQIPDRMDVGIVVTKLRCITPIIPVIIILLIVIII